MSCNCRHLEKLKSARVDMDENSSVYMDYNAACPPDRRVLAEYQNRALGIWANSSSPHLAGQKAQDLLDSAAGFWRKQSIQSGKEEVRFCRGAVEALDILLRDMADPPDRIFTTTCAHQGILDLLKDYSSRRNIPLTLLPIGRDGKILSASLSESLAETGSGDSGASPLLVYSPVNHETGALQDCRKIWEICETRNCRVFLDAPQAAARLPEKEWMPYCSGFSLSGQKIYGLKGSGILVLDRTLSLSEEGPDRFGTPDPAAAAALALAAELYFREREEILSPLEVLTAEGLEILKGGSFECECLSPEDAAPGVLCIALPELIKGGRTMEDLFIHLNRDGIFLSRFSACSGTVNGASRILEHMGFPGDLCTTSLRISLGKKSRRDDFFRLKRSIESFFSHNRIQ